MKNKKNLICFVLLISLAFTMAFGSVTVSAAPKLNRTKVTLLKGEKTTLKVTGTRQKVAWRSSKKSVATVNSKGQVVAKNKGSATIYAKVSKKSGTQMCCKGRDTEAQQDIADINRKEIQCH